MAEKFDNIEVFEDKKLSDVFSDVYANASNNRIRIDELIDQLKPLIVDMDSALIMVPLIKDYLDTSIKNDDLLNKMSTIVARIVTANRIGPNAGGDVNSLLSDADKELIEQIATEEQEIEQEKTKLEKETEKIKTEDNLWKNYAKEETKES